MKKAFAIILCIFVSFMTLGCGGNSHIAYMTESSECPEAFRYGVPYLDENWNIAFYSWNNSTKQTPFGTGYVIANEDNSNDNFLLVKNNEEIFYGLNNGAGNYEYAKVFDYASKEFDICEGLRCSEKRPVKFEDDNYEGLFELIVNGSEEYSGLENLGFFFDTNMSYFFILDFSEDIYANTLNTRMSALKSLRLSTNTDLTEKCELKPEELEAAIENLIIELEDLTLSQKLREELTSARSICEEIKELRTKKKEAESSLQVIKSNLQKARKQRREFENLFKGGKISKAEYREKRLKIKEEYVKLHKAIGNENDRITSYSEDIEKKQKDLRQILSHIKGIFEIPLKEADTTLFEKFENTINIYRKVIAPYKPHL